MGCLDRSDGVAETFNSKGADVIKGIQRIKNLGVFDNYVRPSSMETFAEKNIIYGWNYSGKTTLSRLFHILETKTAHPDYPAASFIIDDASTSVLTEASLNSDSKVVRVFNSDFINNNLKWNGESFSPILLLGEESIETEKAIERNQGILDRCRNGYKEKRKAAAQLDDDIADKKTKGAKQIKTTLLLIEAFTATHLNSILASFGNAALNSFILSQEEVTRLLKLALSSDKDRLELIQQINLTPTFEMHAKKCSDLLTKVPAFSSVIDYLKEHPAIAIWVEQGIPLHVHSNTCEFCGNTLNDQRLDAIRAHFSKDLVLYRESLEIAIAQIDQAKIVHRDISKGLFYPDLREQADEANSTLQIAINDFNAELEKLRSALKLKLAAPFETIDSPTVSDVPVAYCRTAITSIRSLINKNNETTNNFGKEKYEAISRLKKHYVAEFTAREELALLEKKKKRLENHLLQYQTLGNTLKTTIADLEAKINLAQKGREDMNGHIANFLGGNSIQIEVVNDNQNDKFRLVRGGSIARNLSEGEKTAIAFSFFLSKLRELKAFKDAIIYIDDPISSLDSNHIFQVNSIIREQFFYRDTVGNEWKTKCKQLFISTHNFEFFSLLRELPCNEKKTRYYQIKKISQTSSEFTNLPASIKKYASEYHYLYSIIHSFHHSTNKGDLDTLLSIPNAVRRFVELYTFARIPTFNNTTVDQRAEVLFGAQKAKRILKVLHHFSHLNDIDRLSKNTDLICDIENVVTDLMELLKTDKLHFEALEASTIP